MPGRSKFDNYTEFWRDVERAREDIYSAQKGRELIAQPREKGQQELEQAILELCSMCCPRYGRKPAEVLYRQVRIDRGTGCGGVWFDPGELETLAPEAREPAGRPALPHDRPRGGQSLGMTKSADGGWKELGQERRRAS